MKTGFILSLIIIATANSLLAKGTKSVRDPFWPIGYTPPEPVVEKPMVEPEPIVVKAKPPSPPKPVTAEEWKMARKLLKVTGYVLANKKERDTSKRTSIVIINRNQYMSGDIIKIISKDVEYIWRVGKIQNNSVDLKQESATRLKKVSAKRTGRKAPGSRVIK